MEYVTIFMHIAFPIKFYHPNDRRYPSIYASSLGWGPLTKHPHPFSASGVIYQNLPHSQRGMWLYRLPVSSFPDHLPSKEFFSGFVDRFSSMERGCSLKEKKVAKTRLINKRGLERETGCNTVLEGD